MRKGLIAFFLLVLAVAGFAQTSSNDRKDIEIELSFTRQSGYATNQYAIWVETESGAYVKTIYVTKFTAKTGWKNRPDSLPEWVKASKIASMDAKTVDTISGATPKQGVVKYVWNYTDGSNQKLPAGKYVLRIEATTRWKNKIDYFVRLDKDGKITIERKTIGDNEAENAMIQDVKVKSK